MRRLIGSSLLTTALVASLGQAPAPAAAEDSWPPPRAGRLVLGPDFVQRPCPKGVFPAKTRATCGFIRVLQDRDRPQERTIEVAAAIVPARATPAAAEPVLVLPGGPSFGAIDPFYYSGYFEGIDWAANHDLVFVDTRGTGISRPRLGCPEVDRAQVELFYSRPFVSSQGLSIVRDALRQCRARLVERGIRPAAYTTSESVADLEALRVALGVSRWNLLAISADGLLGMSYVRAHPSSIRATIVDSGFSPDMTAVFDYERGLAEMMDAIFEGCATNPACRARYPHLRRDFLRQVTRLNERPRVIRFPDFRPRPVRLRLDGAGLYWDAISAIFPGNLEAPEEIHRLIDTIWRVSHGELTAVYRETFGTGPVTNDHENRFLAGGRTMSYECHDVTNFTTPRDRREAARDLPMFADRYLSPDFDLGNFFANERSPAGCRVWRVGRAAPSQHQPVVSDIPTLVLAGEYDAGVPPYMVRQVNRRLSRSTYVEFPASAHLQLAASNRGSRCARKIAEAFLRSPLDPPDTSCVARLPEFDFTPPRARAVETAGAPLPRRLRPPRDDQVGRHAALADGRGLPRP